MINSYESIKTHLSSKTSYVNYIAPTCVNDSVEKDTDTHNFFTRWSIINTHLMDDKPEPRQSNQRSMRRNCWHIIEHRYGTVCIFITLQIKLDKNVYFDLNNELENNNWILAGHQSVNFRDWSKASRRRAAGPRGHQSGTVVDSAVTKLIPRIHYWCSAI